MGYMLKIVDRQDKCQCIPKPSDKIKTVMLTSFDKLKDKVDKAKIKIIDVKPLPVIHKRPSRKEMIDELKALFEKRRSVGL